VAIFVKDPGATVDYTVAWDAGYLAGEVITQSDWTVVPADPGGITVPVSRVEPGKTVATLSGGRIGRVYRISNHVRLSDGRNDERTLVVRVEDR
jgi:hypothetical protein